MNTTHDTIHIVPTPASLGPDTALKADGTPARIHSRSFEISEVILSPGGRSDLIGIAAGGFNSRTIFHRPLTGATNARLGVEIADLYGRNEALKAQGLPPRRYVFDLVERSTATAIEWTVVGVMEAI